MLIEKCINVDIKSGKAIKLAPTAKNAQMSQIKRKENPILFVFIESAITVTVSPTQLRVREGLEVVFTCRAQGNPVPNVRWTKANQVPKNRI